VSGWVSGWFVLGMLVSMRLTGGASVFAKLDIVAVGIIIDITPRRFIPTALIRWYNRELMVPR
jgi:hypothetical protein